MKVSRGNLKAYLRDNYLRILKKDLNSINSSAAAAAAAASNESAQSKSSVSSGAKENPAKNQKENLSLVWVVKSLRHLDEDVPKSALPQFLDDKSAEFLNKVHTHTHIQHKFFNFFNF